VTFSRLSRPAAAFALILALAGCSIADPDAQGTSGSVAPSTTSVALPGPGPVVTVPGLSSAGTAPEEEGVTIPSGTEVPTEPPVTTVVTTTAQSAGTTVEVPGTTGSAAESSSTSNAPSTSTPATTNSSLVAQTSAAGEVLSVQLTGCDGCSVIGSKKSVAGAYSAALISRAGRGALVSVAADGAVRGVVNIPYGSSFPAPAQALLPCDDDGRCVVTAEQGGTAVLSVFSLDSNGQWTDLSGDGGYPSATGKGGPITVNGSLGVAVQEADGGAPVWMVLTWNGDRFAVLGCAADGPMPAVGDLDPALCNS